MLVITSCPPPSVISFIHVFINLFLTIEKMPVYMAFGECFMEKFRMPYIRNLAIYKWYLEKWNFHSGVLIAKGTPNRKTVRVVFVKNCLLQHQKSHFYCEKRLGKPKAIKNERQVAMPLWSSCTSQQWHFEFWRHLHERG